MRKHFPVYILLEVTGIKKSSYYKWRLKRNTKTEKTKEDEVIQTKLAALYTRHKGCYGVERMTHALMRDFGIKANHKRVYRLMQENGLLAVIKAKKSFHQPERKHSGPNILNRNFEASCPFDKLATDVTVFKKNGKPVYLSPVKDLCTNMIESWAISSNASLKIAIEPLLAIKDKSIPEGTFMHSDQGGLYTSGAFRELLEKNNFIQSLSRKGTPIDNSPMESFFGTLKSELIYNPLITICDKNDLIKELHEYLEYYNNERIQKKLGYLTPAEYKKKIIRESSKNLI